MKRREELRGLSEQHHHGLVAARRLRLAVEGTGPIDGAVSAFLEAWRTEIRDHFRVEEEILLPELSRRLGEEDPRIVRTLLDHVALRRMVRDLEVSTGEALRPLAAATAQRLEEHIRFEERVLFPAVEAALEGTALAVLGEALPRQPGRGCRIAKP